MTEEITRDLFDKLVDLAALELEDDEAEYIRRQLNDQLAAIRELAAVPLEEDTPPAAHGVSYTEPGRSGLLSLCCAAKSENLVILRAPVRSVQRE